MILSDLDGVLADFVGAACKVHGQDSHGVTTWNFHEKWGLNLEEFWGPINALGDEFYGQWVKPLPWCERLLDEMRKADKELVIVTDSSQNWPGVNGKRLWIEEHVGGGVEVILCHVKHLLAAPNRLLVDDNYGNALRFAEFGGCSILFPRPWNAECRGFWDSTSTVYNKLHLWEHSRGRFSNELLNTGV